MNTRIRCLLWGLGLVASVSFAADPPAAIYTDPPKDAHFPARAAVLHIPSHGSVINGLAYVPSGPGPHPVLLICHGLPGNEKNLDLAQAVRRAGWEAVTFNYRGSWGSAGEFRFGGTVADAEAVLAYLRAPKHAAELQLDPQRIAIFGHSMGGLVAALTAAHDPALIGTVLVSAANMSHLAQAPMARQVAEMADNMESLAGVTPESMARELDANATSFSLPAAAAGLSHRPLLVLTADDGLAADGDALVAAVRAAGGTEVALQHVATDHSFSDRRIELEAIVINWLMGLPGSVH
jgi:uncharacterized protein